ncbi:hypothetical protein N7513_004727 [Penicillium frequentans]|uniref:Myb-like domain-containing protein n=1 Tax=Penicillium frequentans TaxID=3151616 RepID=A0AAD6D648_9EURO|nr:hypothetical protein N7513_004727 [Penicillium glabrum]KAJ5556690.1 hypothetical protein N7494_000605 [Penicillium glabrum]
MSPRGILSWSEQEEENFLQWLDGNRALPWKDLPDAYREKFGVDRSVESLRGKKYHILRKIGRTTARSWKRPGHRKRREPRRRLSEQTVIHSDASADAATRSNIDLWFQTILASESGSVDSSESALTRGSISDRLTPALTKFRPKKPRSSTWIWEYVHRMCATVRMDV